MGKRIEDLKVDDTPIETATEPAETAKTDERAEPWYQFVAMVDALLGSGEYDWAFDSLDGMKQTVEHTRRVTEGQQRAVANIEHAGRGGRGGSRRYEGYR